jgi:hypothetical protein
MKRLIFYCLLALGILAFTEHPAHAWVNSKLNIGLNWYQQSGNNGLLWGLWRNGQVPAPEAFGPGPGGPPAPQPSFPGLWGGMQANPPALTNLQNPYPQGGYQGGFQQGYQTMPQASWQGMPQFAWQGTPQVAWQGAPQSSWQGPQPSWHGMPQIYPQTLPQGLTAEAVPLYYQVPQQQTPYSPIMSWNGQAPYQGASYQRNVPAYSWQPQPQPQPIYYNPVQDNEPYFQWYGPH